MNEIREKLEGQICHIHHQKAEIIVLPNEKLALNTCCLLFKEQLYLIALKDKKQSYIDEQAK